MKLLTKSLYLEGLQCYKLLWIRANSKESIPELSTSAIQRFAIGTEIGLLAQKVFPEGVDAESDNYSDSLLKTEEYTAMRKTMFEPSFEVDGLYSRADILVPVGESEWDIVEVKSGTRVKDVNVEDLAFQKYVYSKKGLNIRNCYLMHINNQYVKDGKIIPDKLFKQRNVNKKVKEIFPLVQKRAEEMKVIINSSKFPEVKIGEYCTSPYECPLKNNCWEFLPQESVFDLYREKTRCFELLSEGITLLSEIPEKYDLGEKQKIQREVATSKKDFVNKKEIEKYLKELKYPLYYLDFETINPAIPLFDGMKPYERVGFQYSLHIQDKPNGELKHISFLAEGKDDPRKNFLESLKENLGNSGNILVFNESFEKGVLCEHVENFSEFNEWLETILPRIKDLIIPFRNFHFYSKLQKGSCSIKNILPVFDDNLNYKELEIGKGDLASIEFERVTYGDDVKPSEVKRVRDALLKYCELDTLAEVKIVEGLQKKVDESN